MKTHTDPGHSNHHAHRPSARLALPVLLMVATLAATIPASPNDAQAATKRTDKREVEARKAFAAGQYQQALELYADLYAEKVHPTFLRNIGRCYQNLRQPEKAINAFRDYLRQAKGVTAAERTEVEGYIAEMEQLHKEQEAAQAAARTPTLPAPQPSIVPAVPPVAPEPAPGVTVQVSDQTPVAPPPTPFYKRGWFWGVVGVVVAGAVVGGLYAGGVFSGSSISCTAADGCW